MSAFDPVAFLGTNYEQGFDTRVPLHKPGDWSGYIGTGERDISPREITFQKGERAGQTGVIVDIWFYTEDPSAVGEGGVPPARARQSLFIDKTENGSLDFSKGKNRALGYLLTALGFQNKEGKLLKPWSWRAFPGMRLRYHVEHAVREDTGDIVANVTAVMPPA
jgi:hypothetical protein